VPTMYAVMTDGPKTNLLAIYTSFSSAFDMQSMQNTRENGERFKIEEFDYPRELGCGPFPAFVISVGVGEAYRIVDIVTDRKEAIKIATSIRGKVSTYDAMPSNRQHTSVTYYKWFLSFEAEENDTDTCFFCDSFTRYMSLYASQNPVPILTHRRRYSSSLPHRIEIAAPNSRVAEEIAMQMESELTERFACDRLEYNVDYQLEKIRGKWEIKACLLEASNIL